MTYGRIRRGPMGGDAFTQIRNAVFRDPRLSAKAMGIFGNISTHRDGWGITPESISTQMRDGVNAIKAGLRELEQYGYLQRERERRPDGTLGASTYFITDQPDQPDTAAAPGQSRRSEPTDDFPPVEKPTVDEPTVDDRPHKKTIPSVKKISDEKTTTSPAEPSADAPAGVGDGSSGGGGGSLDSSRAIAEHIAGRLDYQGKPPGNRLRKTITDRLVAALDSGWSVDGLAFYLDLGSYRPDSAAAVYAAKLAPGELPAAEPVSGPAAAHGGVFGPLSTAAEIEAATVDSVFGPARRDTADGGLWERAMRRANERMGGGPRPSTDTTVAGWGAVARQLREPHRPYSNDDWHRPADPFEALKIPWCGDPDCDPVTRLKPGVTPQDEPDPCGACHPMMRF